MAIFKRKVNGKGGGSYWIGYPLGNGKYRREKVGPSYSLAKEILAKRLTEVAERKNFPERVMNAKAFRDVAAKYWSLHGQYLKSKTWRCMLNRVERSLGSKRIGDITPADIQKMFNEIAAEHSVATANRHLVLWRSMFNKAKAWRDFHGENPCAYVKKGKEPPHRLRYLSQEEMQLLLEKAHPRLYPVLMCALLTGMRRGEILGLTWENVSLERDVLYILKSKSGKPRELPIASKLRDVLVTLGPKPSGPVFDLSIIMLRRYFERALKDAGIFGFRWHDTRHSFASWFIMRTNDLPALQNLLGHSTPTMTLRYAHLSKGHLLSEMAAFESAIPVKSEPNGGGVAPLLHQPLSETQMHR